MLMKMYDINLFLKFIMCKKNKDERSITFLNKCTKQYIIII